MSGEKLRGTIHLTNLAQRRPDNVNVPALRGLLDTDDGAKVLSNLTKSRIHAQLIRPLCLLPPSSSALGIRDTPG